AGQHAFGFLLQRHRLRGAGHVPLDLSRESWCRHLSLLWIELPVLPPARHCRSTSRRLTARMRGILSGSLFTHAQRLAAPETERITSFHEPSGPSGGGTPRASLDP